MRELVEGALRFRTEIYPEMKQLFDQLEAGQEPIAMFITCSDSRVDPSLITQTPPGSLFIVRNAGNVIPKDASGGEGASIEYAIEALGIDHIIVCGHYRCGAIQALLDPEATTSLPLVRAWLPHIGEVKDHIISAIAKYEHRDLWQVAVETNVLLQLEHLRQHPSVIRACERGALSLHGWVWDLATGEMFGWHAAQQKWSLLGERGVAPS